MPMPSPLLLARLDICIIGESNDAAAICCVESNIVVLEGGGGVEGEGEGGEDNHDEEN